MNPSGDCSVEMSVTGSYEDELWDQISANPALTAFVEDLQHATHAHRPVPSFAVATLLWDGLSFDDLEAAGTAAPSPLWRRASMAIRNFVSNLSVAARVGLGAGVVVVGSAAGAYAAGLTPPSTPSAPTVPSSAPTPAVNIPSKTVSAPSGLPTSGVPTSGLPSSPTGGLPSLPSVPTTLPSVGLPTLPSGGLPTLPSIPTTLPTLPAGGLPTLPGGGLPTLPTLPSSGLPGLPGLPSGVPGLTINSSSTVGANGGTGSVTISGGGTSLTIGGGGTVSPSPALPA